MNNYSITKNVNLVSVVIPTYKRKHLIERTIQSILNQTYQDFEIIIVDDHSNDSTELIVNAYCTNDSRIQYIQHQTNQGAQAARNTGARKAKGGWIIFLDADDYLMPNSIEIRLKESQNKQVKVVNSSCLILKEDGYSSTYGEPQLGGNIYKSLLHYYGPLFSGLFIATEALKKINYLDESLISYQDWDTSIRLAKHYSFGFIAEPTFTYDCQWSDSISKNKKREAEGYQQVFSKHFFEIFGKLGPQVIGHHYRHIAERYESSGNHQLANRNRILAWVWWPFRVKTIYNILKGQFS